MRMENLDQTLTEVKQEKPSGNLFLAWKCFKLQICNKGKDRLPSLVPTRTIGTPGAGSHCTVIVELALLNLC